MAKAVVSESAIRELLREALENTGAMGHDAPAPAITPNPSMDRPSIELDLDPIEVRHVPRTKNELLIMVRNLLDDVDDDQSGELYKKIRNAVSGDEAGVKDFGKAREASPASDRLNATNDRNIDMKNIKNPSESKLADTIRSIVEEAMAEVIPLAPETSPSNLPDTSVVRKKPNVTSGNRTGFTKPDDDPRAVSKPVTEVAPPGFEKAVKAMKKDKEVDNPFAVAWAMKNKGYKPSDEADEPVTELGEAIRFIAVQALEEAKKKGLPDSFKKNAFKKGAKAKSKPWIDEADALPTKGKKKTKTSDFGGGELAEAIRYIAKQAMSETVQGEPTAGVGVFEDEEFNEMDEANYDAAVAEADKDKLPFGFGKGRFTGAGNFDTSRPGDEDDLEGPPSDTFRARGGRSEDEFGPKGMPLWDPNEDIIDDEEREAALAALTKSAWDPDDDGDEDVTVDVAPVGKKSPKPRIDVGTGYGVEGDTFEKIGEKLGFTPEAAKKAVATAMERFKVLHDMDPDDMEELVMTGVDEYIGMLAKTGELSDEEVKFMHDNADKVEDSEEFRDYFSKFVKRAVREKRADTQDDDE